MWNILTKFFNYYKIFFLFYIQDRPPGGTLKMTDYLYESSKMEDHEGVTKIRNKLDTKPIKPQTSALDRYVL